MPQMSPLTADELVATLIHTTLPTILVEGTQDMTIYSLSRLNQVHLYLNSPLQNKFCTPIAPLQNKFVKALFRSKFILRRPFSFQIYFAKAKCTLLNRETLYVVVYG